MDDIVERLKDQSLQLARRSFDSVDAGLAANVADAAIDEIERLREELLKHHAQRAPESIETAPRDGTPILYWDEKCAIPETVCWLNGSKIVTHGWYPYAGGNWFVDAAREKGAVWWPLPKTVTTTEHSPGCQSGDFGPCDCALTSTNDHPIGNKEAGAS